jgi:hypothetical protein
MPAGSRASTGPAIGSSTSHVAHGYSAAQIVEQYPDLTPAQVHAALTYYYDHQDVMDAALVASYAQAEHQRHHHTPHPKLVAARARQAG